MLGVVETMASIIGCTAAMHILYTRASCGQCRHTSGTPAQAHARPAQANDGTCRSTAQARHQHKASTQAASHRSGQSPKRPATEAASHRSGQSPKRPATEAAIHRSGQPPKRPATEAASHRSSGISTRAAQRHSGTSTSGTRAAHKHERAHDRIARPHRTTAQLGVGGMKAKWSLLLPAVMSRRLWGRSRPRRIWAGGGDVVRGET